MWLILKHLRDLRLSVLGFGATAAAMAVIDTALFPSIQEEIGDFDFAGLGEAFGATGSLGSPDQFFTTEYLSWVPFLLIVFAIRTATALLAGEEQDGTLELLLAQPIARSRIYWQRVAALAIGAALIATLAALGFVITWPFVTIEGLSLRTIVGATFLMAPLALAIGAFGMLAGALGPSRGSATGIAIALAVATYVLFILSLLEDSLLWMRYLTPYYYGQTTTVLTQGFEWWRLALLLLSTAMLLMGGLWAFERRDLGSARSPLLVIFERGSRH